MNSYTNSSICILILVQKTFQRYIFSHIYQKSFQCHIPSFKFQMVIVSVNVSENDTIKVYI